MKRTLANITAAAALCGMGFAAGKNCQPKAEGPIIGQICSVPPGNDDSARLLELIARRAIRQSAPALRHELGAGAEGDAQIRYLVSVSRQGRLSLVGSRSSCDGKECPGISELPEIIGLTLASEWYINPQAEPCVLEIEVKVPSIRKEGSSPLIILPGEDRGIEL